MRSFIKGPMGVYYFALTDHAKAQILNDIAYLVLTLYDFNPRLLSNICPDSSSGKSACVLH